MNNRKFLTTSVVVHGIVILGLIFWPKSEKTHEIIQSMEMVQAGPSGAPVDLATPPLDTPIPPTQNIPTPSQDGPEIKPKAVLKESEEKVSLKKETKKTERKIVKKPNVPPPLPKIKSVLKSKLNTLMDEKPAPNPPVENKMNWVDPNEKKNSPINWIEPGTTETPQPINPEPSSINTDGSSPISKEKFEGTGILPPTSPEETTSDDGAFKFSSPSSPMGASEIPESSKAPETEPLTTP